MGTANRTEKDEPEQQEKSLTAEEATSRIDSLRHVYDEGYISRTKFETMARWIKARVKRSADPADERRLHSPK